MKCASMASEPPRAAPRRPRADAVHACCSQPDSLGAGGLGELGEPCCDADLLDEFKTPVSEDSGLGLGADYPSR